MPSNPKNKYVKNPYPGIRSFNVDESHLFFGREKQIKEISETIKVNHFAAISGASGSGKSSIVKAGLIPLFLKEFDNLEYIIFRPGNSPLKNLANEFIHYFVNLGLERKIVKKEVTELYRNPNALEQIFTAFSIKNKFLIYIDQFEEIFRYRDNEFITNTEESSDIFIQNILNATKSTKIDVFVVFSLRSDFLSDCTVFPGLPDMINKGHYLLPNLTESQKVDLIKKPAEKAGAVISEELLEEIKKHIREEAISLPVIQHTLMRTWDYWLYNSLSETAIDIEQYQAIGTVHNALSVHAENIFNSLNDTQKILVEKIFRALTYGGDERSTRNPQKLSQLVKITGAREMEIIEVIDKFRAEGSSFLMPSEEIQLKSDTVIDISHESIMHVWKRLAEWVEFEAKSAQIYMRLSRSAELYQEGKTGLLVNPDLQIALNWIEEDKPNQDWANRYEPAFDRVINYVNYSKKEYDKTVVARGEKQQRSLKRARMIALFLGSATLISILFMIVALNLKFKAEQSEKDAVLKQELALKQTKIAEERKKEAIALHLIATQQQDIAEQNRLIAEKQKQYAVAQQKEALYQKQQAIISEQEAIVSKNIAQKLQIEAEKLRDEAVEQKLIAMNEKQRAENSEAKTDTLRRLSVAKTLAVQSIKLFDDNLKSQNLSEEDKNLPNILVLQSYYFNKKYFGNIYDSDVFAAFLLIGKSSTKIDDIHSDAVRSICLSSSGENFISASDDGSLFRISVNNPESREAVYFNPNDNIRAVAYSKTDDYIVAGTKSGNIYLWNSNVVSQKPEVSHIHKNIISDIVFVSEKKFVSTSVDGEVVLWNIVDNSMKKLAEYSTKKKNVAICFNERNNSVVVASENGTITTLSGQDLSEKSEFMSENGRISTIYLLKSGDLLVGHLSGLVEIIDKTTNKEKTKWFAHNSAITGIDYCETTNLIVTSSMDRTVKIWDKSDINTAPIIITGHDSWVYSIILSKDEKQLISADANGNILITIIDIETLKSRVKGNLTKNMSEKNWEKFVGEGIDYEPNLPEDL